MGNAHHIAVNQVGTATTAFRQFVHVFQFPDIISTEPSVLSAHRIALHPALVIAPQEAVDIKLHKAFFLFC
jgi:hypothetical protein